MARLPHNQITCATWLADPVEALPAALKSRATPADSREAHMWERAKSFLHAWRSGPACSDVPLPTDKLACHVPDGGLPAGAQYSPVVLVSCGSFNPPTYMHLRMLELARQELVAAGHDVLGAYLSPVNDAYWKRSLAPGRHRLRMCQLAAADSDFIMAHDWEVEQRRYTRTLPVLQHITRQLAALASENEQGVGTVATAVPPRAVLVCGEDVLESMADASIWRQDYLESLLSEHGVVCISRSGGGTAAAALLQRPGALLHKHRANVTLVQEPVPNQVSSSLVRHQLQQGHSVRYLLPEPVRQYIYNHGLYQPADK